MRSDVGSIAGHLISGILEQLKTIDDLGRTAAGPSGCLLLRSALCDLEEICDRMGMSGDTSEQFLECGSLLDNVEVLLAGKEGVGSVGKRQADRNMNRAREILAGVTRKILRAIEAQRPTDPASWFDRLVIAIPLILVILLFGGYLFSALAVNHNEVQLYWQLNGQNFVETESRRVCATMDGQWYSYDFDIGRSNVIGLRVDPVGDGALAASVTLRKFQVRTALGDAWEDVPLTGGQCGNCSATMNTEGLDIVPGGEDPWLELPAFAGRRIQGARVEARIQAAKLWPWKWLTAFFSDVEANCAAGLPSRLVIEFN